MKEVLNVDYTELAKRVKDVKHRKPTKNLTGIERRVVYYMFSQISLCISENLFPKHIIEGARLLLFEVEFGINRMYVATKYKSATRIYAFLDIGKDHSRIIEAINSAMSLVGLETEVKSEGKKEILRVFVTEKMGKHIL
jgi:hypothetical protein